MRKEFPKPYVKPTDDELRDRLKGLMDDYRRDFFTDHGEVRKTNGGKGSLVSFLAAQVILLKAATKVSGAERLKRFERIDERLEALEKALENGVSYRGTFNRADTYDRGDVVTYGGSAFYCLRGGTTAAPAHEDDKIDSAWQLFVRRGRDARGDAR